MGMPPSHARSKFDDIVDFSGVSEFIDTPVKRYSSGMKARLGFSIAAHLEPDVLIVDEVLAVGDASFQTRAYGAIHDLVTSGIPAIVVSHQLNRIAELCTRTLVLEHGAVVDYGETNECIAGYLRRSQAKVQETSTDVPVTIRSITSPDGDSIRSGDVLRLVVEARLDDGALPEEFEPLAVIVRNIQTGEVISGVSTAACGVDIPLETDFAVELELQMNVQPGTYLVETVVWNRKRSEALLVGPSLYVAVELGPLFFGPTQLNAQMRLLPDGGKRSAGAQKAS
jgi:energy-coupling factor transporter ATP-binding protein EcfA2